MQVVRISTTSFRPEIIYGCGRAWVFAPASNE